MIKYLEINNFANFANFAIDFSPKINVIIGDNGIGKTNLLKAAYSCCDTVSFNNDSHIKLLRLFRPLKNNYKKLYNQTAIKNASISVQFFNGHINTVFSSNHSIFYYLSTELVESRQKPVFFPAKEAISLAKWLPNFQDSPFDQTYYDICQLINLPKTEEKVLHNTAKEIIAEIEDACKGRFLSIDNRIIFKTEDAEFPADSIAEGMRKIGMLSILLRNGAISQRDSILFFDYPESAMNPAWMQLFARILLKLSRNGKQIILATHDYVLLKLLDLLTEAKDHVCFHSLYRNANSLELEVFSTSNYLEIKPNSIDAAYGNIIDQEIKKTMDGLGK